MAGHGKTQLTNGACLEWEDTMGGACSLMGEVGGGWSLDWKALDRKKQRWLFTGRGRFTGWSMLPNAGREGCCSLIDVTLGRWGLPG